VDHEVVVGLPERELLAERGERSTRRTPFSVFDART
jgi:hypothetical protein